MSATVWLCMFDGQDGQYILGVYATQELAEKHRQHEIDRFAHRIDASRYYSVAEYPVRNEFDPASTIVPNKEPPLPFASPGMGTA